MDKTKENYFLAALEAKKNAEQITEPKMFVYFDKNGNIKCITPIEDDDLGNNFQIAQFPVSNVRRFVNGETNPNNFFVKTKRGKIADYVIVEKETKVNFLRKLERSLTEVVDCNSNEFEVKITISKNKITIKLDNDIKEELKASLNAVEHANIGGYRVLHFFVTAEKNPDILIEQITIPVSDLLGKGVTHKIKLPKEFSIYARQVFNKYKITRK